MILRARWVLPIVRPPIEDGAVVVEHGRITSVGRWRVLSRVEAGEVIDLGAVALLPGLINAHCHLDYTDMAGKIPPLRLFSDWIKTITLLKAEWTQADYARSWLHGAGMLLRSGTTTVADVEVVPALLPELWRITPLRVFSFLEMTGVRSRRDPVAILQESLQRIDSLAGHRGIAGLSPHAPYSTTPALLRLCAREARRRRLRVTTHVAESALEFEMFRRGRGPMYDWLRRNERDMSDCGQGSPVQQLERCGLLRSNLLAVHVNYLARGDADLLARRRVSVAHCPRSHAYFGHDPFPLARLVRAGVNVSLGTDSLATTLKYRGRPVELTLFAEMRTLLARNPSLDPRQVLEMATVNGARALGLQGRAGRLSSGAFADLIAVPHAANSGPLHEAVVHHVGPVAASMIDGQWAAVPAAA
jgi:cytosine/adenosine deaminase-related metal-dependent hydrolase